MKVDSQFPLDQMPTEVSHLESSHPDRSSFAEMIHHALEEAAGSDHMASAHFQRYQHRQMPQVVRHLMQ
jgi:hypothetical protein